MTALPALTNDLDQAPLWRHVGSDTIIV